MPNLHPTKVFIVNKAGHDFSSAEKFGELISITTGNINVFRPDRSLFQIQEVLEQFDPKSDYLLLSGNVFTNVLAVSVLLTKYAIMDYGIKILVYDAKNQRYLCHNLMANPNAELFFKRSKDKI